MKYRIYRTFEGKIYYLPQSQIGWTDHRHAGLFTEAEWRAMGGSQAHFQLLPIGEDEAMKLAGAPTLPGLRPEDPPELVEGLDEGMEA